MKRILVSVIACAMMLIGTNAHAQLSASVGFTSAKTIFETDALSLLTLKESANLNGAYAGLTYNVPIAELGPGTFGVAPGVYFAYLMKKDANLLIAEGDLSESYLNVPVHCNYSIPVSDGIRFIVFAGPTLQVGLSSKIKIEGTDNDMYDGNFSDALNYKRFDIAVGGGVGMDFEDIIRVTIGGDCGLLNRGGNTVEAHRNQFHVGLAYLF